MSAAWAINPARASACPLSKYLSAGDVQPDSNAEPVPSATKKEKNKGERIMLRAFSGEIEAARLHIVCKDKRRYAGIGFKVSVMLIHKMVDATCHK